MYNEIITVKNTTNYLGIPLNGKGIDWHMYVVQIKTKATKTLRHYRMTDDVAAPLQLSPKEHVNIRDNDKDTDE